jgi:hypothetical protein
VRAAAADQLEAGVELATGTRRPVAVTTMPA